MARIFISYRREDTEHAAARLYRRLELDIPPELLFMDIDNLKLGHDFATALDVHLNDCKAIIPVIGPGWLNAKDKNGRRRLDDSNDFVRLEIAAALERNVLVIPVLVGGAVMPQSADLPEPLKPFSRRLGIALRHESFDADAIPLVEALGYGGAAAGQSLARRAGGWSYGIALAGAAAGALVLLAVYANLPRGCTAAQIYEYPSGRFIREGRTAWREIHQGKPYASFEEFERTAEHIMLVDKSRSRPVRPGEVADFYVRIPVCGGQSHWTLSNPLQWKPLHVVRRVE